MVLAPQAAVAVSVRAREIFGYTLLPAGLRLARAEARRVRVAVDPVVKLVVAVVARVVERAVVASGCGSAALGSASRVVADKANLAPRRTCSLARFEHRVARAAGRIRQAVGRASCDTAAQAV